jgi:hypothetical protein
VCAKKQKRFKQEAPSRHILVLYLTPPTATTHSGIMLSAAQHFTTQGGAVHARRACSVWNELQLLLQNITSNAARLSCSMLTLLLLLLSLEQGESSNIKTKQQLCPWLT